MLDLVFDGTFGTWRRWARYALAREWHPSTVHWRSATDAQQPLFGERVNVVPEELERSYTRFRIPRQTLTILASAACYRDPDRWNLLYRLVWRLMHEMPDLLDDVLDPDVRRLLRMDKQIRRDVHKMHAFVRFREVVSAEGERRYVAWFEPAHDIVLRAVPFFVRRFPSMHWSILTPEISVHWDQQTLERGPGATRRDAPGGDALETLWAAYYANIFNPARVKTRAMCAEMPKRYWINLPEASLINPLVQAAFGRVARF